MDKLKIKSLAVALGIGVVLLLTSCTPENKEKTKTMFAPEPTYEVSTRYEFIETEFLDESGNRGITVMVDTETGVEYLRYYAFPHRSAMCVRYNADGTVSIN